MAEDDFSGKIDPLEYELVRPTLGIGYPKQTIQYVCSLCKLSTTNAWFEVRNGFFRKIYCNDCKEKREKED
jgi:hypothetical protein